MASTSNSMSSGWVTSSLDHLPSEADLVALWQKYKSVFGANGYKVGVTAVRRWTIRYGADDIYEQLSASSLLMKCAYTIAVQVESMLMRILSAEGCCVNHVNDKPFRSEGMAYVYLTTMKANLFCCSMSKCTYVSTLMFVEQHQKEEHSFFEVMEMLYNKRQRMGDAPLPSDLQALTPVPYNHRVWGSTSCEHCGEQFETGALLASHRSACSANEKRSFACQQPGCDYAAKSHDDFQKHERQHAKDALLVARAGNENPHICGVCGKGFATAKRLRKHAFVHQEKSFECERCHKKFSRKDVLLKHQRNHCPPTGAPSRA